MPEPTLPRTIGRIVLGLLWVALVPDPARAGISARRTPVVEAVQKVQPSVVSISSEKRAASFDRLMIAQDTGSAIVGPARADIYWGAGDQAGDIAGCLRHAGRVAMLVPREIDPVVAGARMPLPPERPRDAKASVRTPLPGSPKHSGCLGTNAPGRKPGFNGTRPERDVRSAGRAAAGTDCAPITFPRHRPRSQH